MGRGRGGAGRTVALVTTGGRRVGGAAGGARTAFQVGGTNAAGGREIRGFNPTIRQADRRAAARNEALATGARTITPVNNQGQVLGRTQRVRATTPVTVRGAAGVRPTDVGQYDFRIGGNTYGFSRQPYSTARRLAVETARNVNANLVQLVARR